MAAGRKAGIAAAFILAAAQAFGVAPGHSHNVATVPHHPPKPAIKIHVTPGPPHFVPAMDVNLDTEPHYAVMFKAGQMTVVSQSKDFDPHERRTAASLMKEVMAATAYDLTNANLDKPLRELMRLALEDSHNWAAESVLEKILHTKKEADAVDAMRAQVRKMGLADQIEVNTVSGFPEANKANTVRHDSYTTPIAAILTAYYLSEHFGKQLFDLYDLADKCRTTDMIYKGSNLFVFTKTGTDENQNHTTVTVLKHGNETLVVYQPHLPSRYQARINVDDMARDDRAPNSTTAATLLKILEQKTDIRDEGFFNILRYDAQHTNYHDDVHEVPPRLQASTKTGGKAHISKGLPTSLAAALP